MKKTSKALSMLLSVVMLVTVIAAPASAAFPLYEDFSTPYGSVHCEVQTQNMTPWEPDPLIGISAGTSINSNQTMVWTHVAMEVQKSSTGQVLLSDSKYTYNSNTSSVLGNLRASQTLSAVVFTTHSILYTNSYARYYSTRL